MSAERAWNRVVMWYHRLLDHRQQDIHTQDGVYSRCECNPSRFRRV
ncbi:hypothetical protein SEA_TINYMINY_8 [Microbacterium phage TinyMiny]|nr:hypothetical protein SEA_TINYMINY_8 [Microbacterium phage TinyMiny]